MIRWLKSWFRSPASKAPSESLARSRPPDVSLGWVLGLSGILADGSDSSRRFREHLEEDNLSPLELERWLQEAFQSRHQEQSRFAHQDLINSLGIRLGFETYYGSYRRENADWMRFDGLWRLNESFYLALEIAPERLTDLSTETWSRNLDALDANPALRSAKKGLLLVTCQGYEPSLAQAAANSRLRDQVRILPLPTLLELHRHRVSGFLTPSQLEVFFDPIQATDLSQLLGFLTGFVRAYDPHAIPEVETPSDFPVQVSGPPPEALPEVQEEIDEPALVLLAQAEAQGPAEAQPMASEPAPQATLAPPASPLPVDPNEDLQAAETPRISEANGQALMATPGPVPTVQGAPDGAIEETSPEAESKTKEETPAFPRVTSKEDEASESSSAPAEELHAKISARDELSPELFASETPSLNEASGESEACPKPARATPAPPPEAPAEESPGSGESRHLRAVPPPPDNPLADIQAAFDAGHRKQARGRLDHFLAKHPDHPEATRMAQHMGLSSTPLAQPTPERTRSLLALAELYRGQGNFSKALETLDRLESEEENVQTRLERTFLLLSLEQAPRAEIEAETAFSCGGGTRALKYLGRARYGQGNLAGAQAAWMAAQDLDGKDEETRNLLDLVRKAFAQRYSATG